MSALLRPRARMELHALRAEGPGTGASVCRGMKGTTVRQVHGWHGWVGENRGTGYTHRELNDKSRTVSENGLKFFNTLKSESFFLFRF